jgi:hypothetical protein
VSTAATSHAKWQGPLVAIGIGPFGPLAPYSYPPYSHVYSSQPVVQFPPVYPQQQQRPTSLGTCAGYLDHHLAFINARTARCFTR